MAGAGGSWAGVAGTGGRRDRRRGRRQCGDGRGGGRRDNWRSRRCGRRPRRASPAPRSRRPVAAGAAGSATGVAGLAMAGAAGTAGTTTGAAGRTVMGAAGSGGAAPPVTPTSPPGATIVPLYTRPDDASWPALIAAKKAHPTVGIIAVVNPNSGPGSAVEAELHRRHREADRRQHSRPRLRRDRLHGEDACHREGRRRSLEDVLPELARHLLRRAVEQGGARRATTATCRNTRSRRGWRTRSATRARTPPRPSSARST